MNIKSLSQGYPGICLLAAALTFSTGCKRDIITATDRSLTADKALTTPKALLPRTSNLNFLAGTPKNYPVSAVVVSTIDGIDVPGGPGSTIFKTPGSVAADGSNFIWVSDYEKNQVLLVSKLDGRVFVTVGTGNAGAQDGSFSTASFNHPSGIALSPDNILYVADLDNNRIRAVNLLTSTVSTFAGTGVGGFADGAANVAKFNRPFGIAVDANRTVYVADYGNNMIRRITPAGGVSRWAGQTAPGSADATGALASFSGPASVAVAPDGAVYVADINNNKIRKIVSGTVSTFAGSPDNSAGLVDGAGTAAKFHFPSAVTVDATGNLYVTEQGNHTVRLVTPTGMVKTMAGNGAAGFANGVADAARFFEPMGITIDPAGTIFVADRRNQAIRKVAYAPAIKTLAGNGQGGYQEGTGSGTIVQGPHALTMGPNGMLYFLDGKRNIRKCAPDGTTSQVLRGNAAGFKDGQAALAQFGVSVKMAVGPDGTLYFADYDNRRVRKLANGIVSTLAGNGNAVNVDGTGANASFRELLSMAVDPAGNIYVGGDGALRKVTPAGVVTTVISPNPGNYLNLTFDASGDLFFLSNSNEIWKIPGNGQQPVSLYAFRPQQSTILPVTIASASDGTIYMADWLYTADPRIIKNGVHKMNPDHTLIPMTGANLPGDLDGPVDIALFQSMSDMVVGSNGIIYFCDYFNNKIKMLSRQ